MSTSSWSRWSRATDANAASRPADVLPRLDRADPRDVWPAQIEPLLRDGDLVEGCRMPVGSEQHDPQPVFVDPCVETVAPRRFRRAHHDVRVGPCQLQAATHEPVPPVRQLVRSVEEGQVVDRDDEGCPRRRDDEARRVHDVDGSCRRARLRAGASRATPRRARLAGAEATRRAPEGAMGPPAADGAAPKRPRPRRRRGPRDRASGPSAATAVPPGTRCQHCSIVRATRRLLPPVGSRRRSWTRAEVSWSRPSRTRSQAPRSQASPARR